MDYDFVNVCREELRLCGVHEGEAVAILSSDAADELMGHAAAFMQAAKELGALPYHVRVPAHRGKAGGAGWSVGQTPLTDHPAAMAALKEAAIVVDLVFMLFSKEQLEIQASGTRILLAVEPVDVLTRLLPTTELRERVEFAGDLLASAQSLRVQHENGTDLTYRLGKYPTITEYGYTDEPGRWTTGRPASSSPGLTTTASTARWCSLRARSSTRSSRTSVRRSACGSSTAGSSTSAASSTPSCSATTWTSSTTRTASRSPTSAGV
ncbi:MAG TPA: hypothetical protein VME70_03560 [Mycobacteriales bacterium]|nr:hypothetical protein [Mycobacteriales bacterium]